MAITFLGQKSLNIKSPIKQFKLKKEYFKMKRHTMEEYVSLPLEQREKRVWFWPFKWYQPPEALAWNEWNVFRVYAKKNYPVQHFLREDVYIEYFILTRRFKDLKYWIKSHIINPRRKMRAVVFPPRYRDLNTIIVAFCLECIVEYVDREKCFDVIVWDSDEEHIQRARVIKEIYNYAKTGRKTLQDKIDKEWERIPVDDTINNPTVDHRKKYETIDLLEQEMKDLDTKYCSWVVSNRDYLWT